ncbi:MAG: hypothetical protein V1662_00325 [Candidatus Omnitrophota bacterium]
MTRKENMSAYLSDTNPEIEEVQISLIRQAGTAERVARMRSLSQTTINLSRRAIFRAHPEYTERELDVAFVSLHYGREVASRLAEYLTRKGL